MRSNAGIRGLGTTVAPVVTILRQEKLAPCPADDRDGGQARSGLTVLDERPGVQFRHGLPQLFLRVHDNWAVPRNGFLNRLS